jgi:hypothetical protein
MEDQEQQLFAVGSKTYNNELIMEYLRERCIYEISMSDDQESGLTNWVLYMTTMQQILLQDKTKMT